jgi:hypothetical protein
VKTFCRRSAAGAFVAIAVATWLYGGYAMAADGLTSVISSFGPKETMDRLEAEIKAKGMTVFARIDHAAGAAAVGLPLRPTELLIFGNAKGGTPLELTCRSGAGLAGWIGQNMAVVQRSRSARETPRAGP